MEKQNCFIIRCKGCNNIIPPLFGTLHTVKDKTEICDCASPQLGIVEIFKATIVNK